MKQLKLIMLFCVGAFFIATKSFGQANPFINVLPDNSGRVAVGCPLDLVITIGNTGPSSAVPQAKLRPIIQVPTSVIFLPNAQQTGLPAGWTILSNTGTQLRLCNSTDSIPVTTSRTIILKTQGVTATPIQTFSGNINFGNGTTCTAGTTVAGDIITDNSALSTITVVDTPTFSISGALTSFATTVGVPSSEQSFTLSGSDITEDVLVTAPTGFEVSNTSGSGFASTATVVPTAGVLMNYPIYLRLAASASTGSVTGNVINASVSTTCVVPQNISVSGTVTNPLTVSLANFSAEYTDCMAQLNWLTTSEKNTEKFEIQKSDGTNGEWKTIGTVLANGNTSSVSKYNFKDENIFTNSMVLYRLKIIDNDGSFEYSQTLNKLMYCNKQGLSVFPNPVTNGALLVTLNGEDNVEANLSSVTGQQLKSIVLEQGVNSMDVSELSNGVYILSAKFAKGKNHNIKVNIQK